MNVVLEVWTVNSEPDAKPLETLTADLERIPAKHETICWLAAGVAREFVVTKVCNHVTITHKGAGQSVHLSVEEVTV